MQTAQTVQTEQALINPALPNNTAGADPAPAPIEGSPGPANPMLDRGLSPNAAPPAGAPAPAAGDALLEGEGEPLPTDKPDIDPQTATLEEMIGSELMQDPGSSLVAKSLMRLMQGADPNRAFAKAIEHDDTRFIDTAYLEEKLGKESAEEAIKAVEYLVGYTERYAQELQERLYKDIPGGEQAVQLAAKHFRAAASPAEHKAVARMLDSGDFELMQYGMQRIMEFGQQLPQGPQNPQTRHTATPTTLQPLSRAEFGRMVLQKPNMSEQEYQNLSARLAAGLQRR